MYDDVLTLIAETFSEDEIGQQKAVETRREVFCRVGQISRTEWFNGGRNGLKPEMMFEIFHVDYAGEKSVEFKGSRYTVYRTYSPNSENVELYCERRVGA